MTDRWYPGPVHPSIPRGLQLPRRPHAVGALPAADHRAARLQYARGGAAQPRRPARPARAAAVADPADRPRADDRRLPGARDPRPRELRRPRLPGLEEDIDVHLQGIRLGELYLPICSCEQWYDQSTNIETRTDKVLGNEHLGYDWGAQCTPNDPEDAYEADGTGTGTWSCPNPHDSSQTLTISDLRYKRMRAQVNNDAAGWNDLANVLTADSEPVDPRQIKGNYTHDDDAAHRSAELGYDLTIPISMANDYNGYIATYREYQRGDHYRKALTGWGPHSSDYMATRLVYIGRALQDPDVGLPSDMVDERLLEPKTTADLALNDARATALGTVGKAAVDAYEAALPDEAPVEVVSQPADTERFGAAFFTWNGGSNFTDNPVVTVRAR